MSGATQEPIELLCTCLYRAITVSGDAFLTFSSRAFAKLCGSTAPPDRPYNPTAATPVGLTPQWFGLTPVRSPLLRGYFLFLGVLRCFSSPGALHTNVWYPHKCGWVAPFGDRGIKASSRLPPAYRSYATSFIGTQRRGIHHMLIVSSLREHTP